jgi:NlpC/P60 family putative phage cell wall peptidase
MTTGQDIVNEARTWIGTPFQHQGRVKGRAVDCVGLVVGVARAVGFEIMDEAGYSRQPFGQLLQSICDAQGIKVDKPQPGDVLMMRFIREPQHLAIYAGDTLIHTHGRVGKVVEHRIDPTWQRRIVAVYRFKELA